MKGDAKKTIKYFTSKTANKELKRVKTSCKAKREPSVYIHSKNTNKNSSVGTDKDELESQKEVFYDAREEETPKTENTIIFPVHHEDELRTTLPAKQNSNCHIRLWSVLKDMIGREDLPNSSLPVYFNEPLSMLQRIAEIMENEDLLVKANTQSDSLRRMAYVSVFNAAQFNGIVGRKLKPFNAILGETYEYIVDNYKFFSEQVDYHVSACHAESESYEMHFGTSLTSHFWAQSLTFTSSGQINIILKKHKEHYVVDRPNINAQNIAFGKTYLDCSGSSTTMNMRTTERCVLTFHGKGWSESSYGLLDGFIFNAAGERVIEIKGKWNKSIWMTDLRTGKTEMLWKRCSEIKNWESYYCFTKFAMQLNSLPERLKNSLPLTDSRFRPDLRALENGDIKLASEEKFRLEELQRTSRKNREDNNIEYKPKYFTKQTDEITKEKSYVFNGRYWDDRKTHNWSHLPKIY
jgi:hypothetical protein